MPVFLWNHAHRKLSKTLKVTETQAAQERARARKGEAQEPLNGNNLKGAQGRGARTPKWKQS